MNEGALPIAGQRKGPSDRGFKQGIRECGELLLPYMYQSRDAPRCLHCPYLQYESIAAKSPGMTGHDLE